MTRKGVKALHCVDINNTTELLGLHLWCDLDLEQGPAPYYYYLKPTHFVSSAHPIQCLLVDTTTRQLEFNINTYCFDFEANKRRNLKPNLLLMGLKMLDPYLLIFQ